MTKNIWQPDCETSLPAGGILPYDENGIWTVTEYKKKPRKFVHNTTRNNFWRNNSSRHKLHEKYASGKTSFKQNHTRSPKIIKNPYTSESHIFKQNYTDIIENTDIGGKYSYEDGDIWSTIAREF